MGNLLQDILGNVKTRIMFIIYMSIIVISGFFIIYGYFSQLAMYEESELKRLKGIVSSLAVQMNGDAHVQLIENNIWMDDIKEINDDSLYLLIHNPLAKTQKANELSEPIFTMYYDEEERIFLYIVRSDEKVAYRAKYEMFPDILLANMDKGGVIDRYETENGEWISAFYPFYDSNKKLAGVVEADIEFGQFKTLAFQRYRTQGLISLAVISLLALMLIPYVRGVLKDDEKIKIELFEQKTLIESRNLDLTESLNYASKIQEAMLPKISDLTELIPNSFVFYKPREVVSGDFYWFKKAKNDTLYIAIADCSGHGVPGALMSVIGQSKLNAIVHHDSTIGPAAILEELDHAVTESLSNKSYQSESIDGMDIGIMKIDLKNKKLQFAGAMLNLIQTNAQTITETKGNRFPVGGGSAYQKSAYDVTEINIQPGDHFYLYSDGFPDQFGGLEQKKYLNKNFKQLLTTLEKLDETAKIEILNQELTKWQGDIEQLDDVLVLGVAF